MSSTVPGSRLPAAVQSLLLLRDPVGHFERQRRRHGPVFQVRFVGIPRYVYVADADLARQVYATDRTIGRAGEARRDFLEPLVGSHSLLVTEGDEWLRHRKLLGPAFHRRQVEGYAGEIAALATAEIATWPVGEPLQLRPRMQAITLEVILRLVFGITDEARLSRLRDLLPRLANTGTSVMWLVPPTVVTRFQDSRLLRRIPNPIGRFLALRDEVDAILYDEIRSRRRAQDVADRSDVLSLLLQSRDEDGRGLDDAELRDELVTLLEAGHETTATALSWAFERLLRTPRVLARLLESLDAGEDEYLEAVVKETLRARPVVIDTPRLLVGPLELGGVRIPEGWYVAPALPLVQDDVAQPKEFRPERFLEGDPPRDAWIPFGGGKRHCVGSHLALLELRVILAEVLRRVELAPVRAEPERARVEHVTLVPSELARAVVVRRRQPGAVQPPSARSSASAAAIVT